MKKILTLVSAIGLAFIIPYGFAKVFSDFISAHISFDASANYLWGAFSHRAIQFFISFALLCMIMKWADIKSNFGLNQVIVGLKRFKWIFVLWPILTMIFFACASRFIEGFNQYLINLYPIDLKWVLAKIGRDVLLLDAFSEEILYRAFIITLLKCAFKESVNIRSFSISHAALLSVPIFALSHIQVSLFPFTIVSYDVIQLGLTLITGLMFAYAYERTQRIMVPVILHGFTNLAITLSAYILLIFI